MAQQLQTAVFDGTQDSQALVWATAYDHFRLLSALKTTGPIPRITISAASSAGCTINTNARFTGSVDVRCLEISVRLLSIAITPSPATVARLGTRQLTAMGTYDDGTIVDITTSVSWSLQAPTFGSINASGLLTAANIAGTTTIAAELEGVSSSDNLTVT